VGFVPKTVFVANAYFLSLLFVKWESENSSAPLFVNKPCLSDIRVLVLKHDYHF